MDGDFNWIEHLGIDNNYKKMELNEYKGKLLFVKLKLYIAI